MKRDARLLFGHETAEDAGVYKLTEDVALIQTVDFFTPVVDDPFLFGKIAATNALSDIYAMGGKPLTAMNVVCFPSARLDISILRDIIRGGQEKINEAGALLVGGHSVDDKELKYGLSVTGVIHPDDVWSNNGARVGDKIILTKPLGIGIINTAIKGGIASLKEIEDVIMIMTHLNRVASEIMRENGGINACTDVTGFGLIGHLFNICRFSNVTARLYTQNIPIIEGAVNYSQMGLIPQATHNNRKFYQSDIRIKTKIPDYILDILFDPQTSGGLLICVNKDKSDLLLNRLFEKDESWCREIGEIEEGGKGIILD